MTGSESFKNVCAGFFTQSHHFSTLKDMIDDTVKTFCAAKDRPNLQAYLDEILSPHYSDREREQIYAATHSGLSYSNGGLRTILEMMRDACT